MVQFVPSAGKGKEARDDRFVFVSLRFVFASPRFASLRLVSFSFRFASFSFRRKEGRREGRREGMRSREEGGRRDELNQRGPKRPWDDALKSNEDVFCRPLPSNSSLVSPFISTVLLGFFGSLPSRGGFFVDWPDEPKEIHP